MSDTNPMASGSTTSEWTITKVAMVVGGILEGAAVALGTLQGQVAAGPWLAAVLAVIGVLLQVAAVFGYQKGRTVLKATMISQLTAPKATPPNP